LGRTLRRRRERDQSRRGVRHSGGWFGNTRCGVGTSVGFVR
jgi:hypothetical protein